jgi:hypothetical protein
MSSDDTNTIELLRSEEIVARLKVNSVASMADTNWLSIEFENLTDSGYRIKSLWCSIEREDSSTTTDDRFHSGDIFSGNSMDLFPHYFDSTHPVQIYVQPGLYETYQYVSDYSSTLLGLPTEDTIVVRAVLHLKVNWNYPEFINTPPDGVPFEFLWIYPDSSGFKAMQKRMRYLLQHPLRIHHSIIENTLMHIPEVADAMQSIEILDRLTGKIPSSERFYLPLQLRRSDNWRIRPNLWEYIDSYRANDPIVLEYLERLIETGNQAIVSNLCVSGRNLWSEKFVEPVLNEMERGTSLSYLPYMWEHRDKWPEELSISSRLSALICKHRSFPKTPSEYSSKHEILTVAYTLTEFGYTCDTTILPLIIPYLEDTTQWFDVKNKIIHKVRSPARPSRICDNALEAVLRILGVAPGDAYSEAMKESDFRKPITTDSRSRDLRDRMIKDLKKQLSEVIH